MEPLFESVEPAFESEAPLFESDEPDPDAPPSEDPPSLELVALAAFVRALLVDDRSFFAQPDPLKWIAGLVGALRMEPSVPQLGQKRGPASLIPWITSTRCLQLEQT